MEEKFVYLGLKKYQTTENHDHPPDTGHQSATGVPPEDVQEHPPGKEFSPPQVVSPPPQSALETVLQENEETSGQPEGQDRGSRSEGGD